ncbi:MAG: hypothetical protein ACE5HP_02675 [Gemmatimonadota bacterium]
MTRKKLLASVAALATVGFVAGGCGEMDSTGPAPVQFSEQITFETFQQRVTGVGESRVEIELPPGSAIADEVELEESQDVLDDEEIEGRAIGLPGATCPAGTVTLAVGAFQVDVDFTAGTEFEAEGSGSDDITCQEFRDAVEAALANGQEPRVEAERPPPATPQDPDDPSFSARELKLDEDEEPDDEDEIEINIDADNLEEGAGGAIGVIRVLGMEIQIGPGTEIEAEAELGEVDFEGIVDCGTIDLADDTFVLTNGTVIRIVAGTEVEVDLNGEDGPGTLQDVQDACDAGLMVEAEGEGVVESTDPLTIVATEVEFEEEDED